MTWIFYVKVVKNGGYFSRFKCRVLYVTMAEKRMPRTHLGFVQSHPVYPLVLPMGTLSKFNLIIFEFFATPYNEEITSLSLLIVTDNMNIGNEGTPLEWLVFYSDTAGREYYYEPKSKLVTWILPDDAHPSGTTNSTSQRRKNVTFHDSVATTILTARNESEIKVEEDDHDVVVDKDDDDDDVEPKNTNQWIAPLLLLIIIATTLGMYDFIKTKAKIQVEHITTINHDTVLVEPSLTRIDFEGQQPYDGSVMILPLKTSSNPVSEQQIRLKWERIKDQMESLLGDHDDQTVTHQSLPVTMEDPVATIHEMPVIDQNTDITVDETLDISVDENTGNGIDENTGITVDEDTDIGIDVYTDIRVDEYTDIRGDENTGNRINDNTGITGDESPDITGDENTGNGIDENTGITADEDTDNGIDVYTDIRVDEYTDIRVDENTDTRVNKNTDIRADEYTNIGDHDWKQKVEVLKSANFHDSTRDHTPEQGFEVIEESFDLQQQHQQYDKGCLIPLSHFFSKRCRALAKERTLIDISAILDGMMQ